MRDISLHILDIMQNSVAAEADAIKVIIREKQPEQDAQMLEVAIEDNGCGMDQDKLSVVENPFSTTRATRRVGLGIPLFKASAERTGGTFGIISKEGAGTIVTAGYMIQNIDRPPLGDLAGVITDMAASNPEKEIKLELKWGEKRFVFDSREVARVLGEVRINEFEVVKWLREYISEGIKDIFGGVLSEINS